MRSHPRDKDIAGSIRRYAERMGAQEFTLPDVLAYLPVNACRDTVRATLNRLTLRGALNSYRAGDGKLRYCEHRVQGQLFEHPLPPARKLEIERAFYRMVLRARHA